MEVKRPASVFEYKSVHYLVADEGPDDPHQRALVCVEGLRFDIPEGLSRMVVVLSSERPHKDCFYLRTRLGKVTVDHSYGLDLPPYAIGLIDQFPGKEAYFSLETEAGEVLSRSPDLRPLR